jgi:hypothetical protein
MWRVIVDIMLLMVVYGVTLSQKPTLDNISTFLSMAKQRESVMFLMRSAMKYAQKFALLSPANLAVLSILQNYHGLLPVPKMEYDYV